jgi:hypothetical protein
MKPERIDGGAQERGRRLARYLDALVLEATC